MGASINGHRLHPQGTSHRHSIRSLELTAYQRRSPSRHQAHKRGLQGSGAHYPLPWSLSHPNSTHEKARRPRTGLYPGPPSVKSAGIPWHPTAPNPRAPLTSVPAESTFFAVTDLCSAFFSILVDRGSRYLFTFAWEGWKYTRTVTPQSHTEPFLTFCKP